MGAFWDWFWFIFTVFAFTAYLFAMFTIVIDMFRDRSLSGWAKASWLIALIFLPVLTALIYLIARGDGMASRSAAEARAVKAAQDEYIRSVAVSSPAEEIAKAKELLDSGTITQAEFDAMKAKALS